MEEKDNQLLLTKKGKPRKRKPKEPRIYFTKDTEEAILEYLSETDQAVRNEIYNTRIAHSFYKLSENIIHTFKFYYTDDTTIEDLKHEVVTFLLEKLHLYKQNKGAAYSYFGTIAKRYLIILNKKNYQKLQDKIDINEVFNDNEEETNHLVWYDTSTSDDINLSVFMDIYVNYVSKNLFKLFPKSKDSRVADSILELFRKRETLDILENKKALYIYIREMINVETPHITKIVKKLKQIYVDLFNEYYEHGHINKL